MKKASMKVLAVVSAVALFGLVGQMDYNDEQMLVADYCNQVEAGSWPAYRDDIICSKVEGE